MNSCKIQRGAENDSEKFEEKEEVLCYLIAGYECDLTQIFEKGASCMHARKGRDHSVYAFALCETLAFPCNLYGR